MNVHEYQAKAILARYGVPIPRGVIVSAPEEAAVFARSLGRPVVLKAQIQAGGRGLAGGIKVAADPDKARRIAAELLGKRLVTPQTGPQGAVIRFLLGEELIEHRQEYYLGLTIDRRLERVVLIASTEGGTNFENMAAGSPHSIVRETLPPREGLSSIPAGVIAANLGLSGEARASLTGIMTALGRAFRDNDASLIEINPLALRSDGGWMALDAKMVFDDNALPRHPELADLRDTIGEDPREIEAAAAGLSYIALGGDIGCMVNGAGLAMATADIIRLTGGQPANFLDVGGGVNEDAVRRGFLLLLSDPNIKSVLVNIFGGIVRCDLVAAGIVKAVRESGLRLPLVIRLKGTNVEDGKRLLAGSGIDFEAAETMDEAAAKAVRAAGGERPA